PDRSPINLWSPNVFDHLHTLFTIARPLLERYTTAEECGQGNCNVIAELCDDPNFEFTAEMLHDVAADASFAGETPVIDYSMIEDVQINFGLSIAVTFRICFFTELGHSDSPARFSIIAEEPSTETWRVEYGCGLLDEDGRFWYPRTDKDVGRYDMPPTSNDQWAYFQCKRYGHGLSEFVRGQTR
ncbi:hypothetical protein, partial [Stieleria mannarensis]|uniref:hypothetical protein n=1 Tax=Stieleria mannarensis TaxID=2755585 RepID=UPI001C71C2EB